MKRAVILVNAYTRSEHELFQPKRLRDELSALGVSADILRNGAGLVHIRADGSVACELADYDFCIYLDKDKYTSEMLEACGMRLFNRHGAVRACDDKVETLFRLAGSGLCVPETYPGLLCYTQDAPLMREGLEKIAARLGYPLIVKESYGSLGKQVYLARDFEELCAIAAQVQKKPHLFQSFVASSRGRDVRLIAVGGEAVAAMERHSERDFRSNVELGGSAREVLVTEEMRHVAAVVSRTLSLDYCGIDLLYGKEGFLVCEVNSNAFFGGIERVTGKNIAKRYAEYICDLVYGAK